MAFYSKEVSIEGKIMLKGTLTIPKRDESLLPAVLIIPGTGKLNRDGNANRGKMQLNIYRDLAEYITSLGFITLRYDKRGVGSSEGKVYETGMWDLVDDAEAAVQLLKNHPKVHAEKVIVLGHSEGTILATALSTRTAVAGLILLSGAGSKLDEALKSQQEQAYEELKKLKGLKGFLIQKLKVVEKSRKKNEKFFNDVMNEDKDIMRMNFVRMSSKWFREHFTYDLFGDYSKIDCPVLAITGKKDFQADYKALETLSHHITSSLETYAIEGMNHALKEQKEDVSILEAKKLYINSIGEDFHKEFKDLLANWLVKNFNEEK